jgi:CubicO group peptidase (beta-lactamase class C family)
MPPARPGRRFAWSLLIVALLAACTGGVVDTPATAGATPTWDAARADDPAWPPDPALVEAFADRFFGEALANGVPGAVFVLVRDGKVVVSKGYGYADLETRTPMSPESTIVRVGSVSKLFTATAVMQLVEQDRLSLDSDIRGYLEPLGRAGTYPDPITVADLLAHTSGLEDNLIGIEARSQADVTPLEQFLARTLPAQALRPHSVINYSNYNSVLAGYLVERASGLPFEDYMQDRVLRPLGMEHSSFRLRPDQMPHLALGYLRLHGIDEPAPLTYTNLVPAGGLHTTALDMARFLVLHLQETPAGPTRLLAPATLRLMHQQYFTNDPRLPGVTLGFFEEERNDRRALRHGGVMRWSTAELLLLPEHGMGFFAAVNTLDQPLLQRLDREFLDLDRPIVTPPPALPERDDRDALQRFTGTYRPVASDGRTIGKLWTLFQQVDVVPHGDGSLAAVTHFGRQPIGVWASLGNHEFGSDQVTEHVLFREQPGNATRLFIGGDTFVRANWYETYAFQRLLLVSLVAVFGLTVIRWPARVLMQRSGRPPRGAFARLAPVFAWAASGLNLTFCAGLYVLLQINPFDAALEVDPWLVALMYLPLTSGFLTMGLVIALGAGWTRRDRGVVAQLELSLTGLAAVAFLAVLNYWNMLGFKF